MFTGNITVTLKSLSSTGWGCCDDSKRVHAEIRVALQMLDSDNEEQQDTKRKAAALCNKLGKLEAHKRILGRCYTDSSLQATVWYGRVQT